MIQTAALGADVSYDRLIRAVTRGEVPAHSDGTRYRIAQSDIADIAAHFARINAARAVALRVKADRLQRKASRSGRR